VPVRGGGVRGVKSLMREKSKLGGPFFLMGGILYRNRRAVRERHKVFRRNTVKKRGNRLFLVLCDRGGVLEVYVCKKEGLSSYEGGAILK